MSLVFSPSKFLIILFMSVVLLQLSGCKKDNISPTYLIQGLWTGTYTVSSADPVYGGQSFFLSFTIYPDGTMIYKGKTPGNDVYANGTWSLTANAFSFKITTLNYDGGFQHTQTGTALFNSTTGTLSNGAIVDLVNNGKGSWTLTRSN